jgi:hypothetical protein
VRAAALAVDFVPPAAAAALIEASGRLALILRDAGLSLGRAPTKRPGAALLH